MFFELARGRVRGSGRFVDVREVPRDAHARVPERVAAPLVDVLERRAVGRVEPDAAPPVVARALGDVQPRRRDELVRARVETVNATALPCIDDTGNADAAAQVRELADCLDAAAA